METPLKQPKTISQDPKLLNLNNRKPFLFLTLAVVMTGLLGVFMISQIWASYNLIRHIKTRHLRVEALRGTITHLDEVLTMSARMAAVTGDMKWKVRYMEFEPQLTVALKEVMLLSPKSYEGTAAEQTDAANIKLVEMEGRAFELVEKGQAAEAQKILSGVDYEVQKRIYAEGMKQFNFLLGHEIDANLESQKKRLLGVLGVLLAILPVWLLLWGYLLRLLSQWKSALLASYYEVERKAGELLLLNKVLDQKVAERTEELEKVAQVALAASKTKSEFLAVMSHEIRTPMNASLGMGELLAEGDLPAEQMEYVETLRRNGEHLLNLINDILDLSKIEVGKLELEAVAFDLYEVVENVTELMAVAAHQKGLELLHHIASDVPSMIIGDGNRLRQVLTNLIGNAIKFTEKGEVVVEINCGSTPQTHPASVEIMFKVRDTGIGIPPEQLEHVFGAFTQVDSSTTRRFGGTGLGLSISKQFVELMGGRLWAESQTGRGSTFYFTASFERAEQRDLSRNASGEDYLNLKDMKILIVDDNATNRFILKEMLKGTEAVLSEAEDGLTGLKLLRTDAAQGRPHRLILLDCRMPGMDGFEFVRQVKMDPTLKSVPIMMLTSDDRKGHAEQAKMLGLALYMVKPIRKSELLRSICQALDENPEIIPGSKKLETPVSLSKIEDDKKFKILLVEDNADNRLLIQSFLKKTDYHIEIAVDGKEALEKAKVKRYGIVLMDLHMPVMDGYEATRRIRQWEKEERGGLRMLIVALSASALQSEVVKSIEAGCDRHLTKPIKKEFLLKVLKEYEIAAHVQKEAA